MSISVNSVTKMYGEQSALNNISFEINVGEVVGFLGPNGAGKSTMMKIITCCIPPTEGVVSVCDLDVMSQALEVRKRVGYLPENNPLYPDMYVKEYLEYVANIYKLSAVKSRVEEMIELTGLTLEYRKKVGQLSKGYRQRLGLAQALIHDPEVLILDEPTSGLDPNQLIEIRKLIKASGENKTILLSTHIMQEVEMLCDRVIIIDKGDIVADRATENIQEIFSQKGLRVEFAHPVIIDTLRTLPYVVDVIPDSSTIVEILVEGAYDIREDIFNWAVEHNNAVLSQTERKTKLEDIFHSLTTEK